LDDTTPEPTESFTVTLSNATGGSISPTNNVGVATILDNDTKFYVINDATADQTFEYGIDGTSIESYNLGSGDTAPRGAAANAAGTTVWVVDSNKTVYVYNNSGGLLGSWTPSGLNGSVQVEGIATNGTDIWLVDAKGDKVYKYTGAASRLSGSQSAASSFSLASGDSNAKGIVTDGTSLWAIDDGKTDKVYKYSLSGSLLGSWTIDSANSSPTGLTLNPNSPSDIWIVDSGTKKVYQYTAAASRTSGSQNAAASFALAAGNTNPQDIADPPGLGKVTTPEAPNEGLLEGKTLVSIAPSIGNHSTDVWRWYAEMLPQNPSSPLAVLYSTKLQPALGLLPALSELPGWSHEAARSVTGSWQSAPHETASAVDHLFASRFDGFDLIRSLTDVESNLVL
jgi:hypothetical protein